MADDQQRAPSEPLPEETPALTAQQKVEMLADEDPLLISQSLTYVTDDGSVLHSFQSAPFSTGMEGEGAALVCSRTEIA
eukprot:scaffold34685_cov183-Amphora_coffeaeformis.AAC.28